MLGATPLPPTPGQVVVAILAVLGGAVIAAAAARRAWLSRNWLYHLGTAGGLLIVAGITGQRMPTGGSVGPWDAGISIPGVGINLTPVCAAGLVMSLLCLTLVLLFERVPDPDAPSRTRAHRPLEEDDAV
jgi:hypothetical protein